MKFLKSHGVIIFSIIGVFLIVLYATFYSYVENPVDSEGKALEIEIARGTNFSVVVNLLEDAGLITHKKYFLLLAHVKGAPKNIRAGEYELNSSMSPGQIIDKLMEGRVKGYRVSIPEGFTVRQIASRLAAKGIVDEKRFIALTQDRELLASLRIKGEAPKGIFSPIPMCSADLWVSVK
ncbi:MAG: endolytic transglycosylase MltG [Syntrophaceae bacterium]|nr:endolytic transglycosylase MltG [Syntrophaceae bacterium]